MYEVLFGIVPPLVIIALGFLIFSLGFGLGAFWHAYYSDTGRSHFNP